MELINKILAGFEAVLAHVALVSIVLGLIICLAGVQWIKGLLPSHPRKRWFIRLIGLPLGFFPTYFMWPSDMPGDWQWGLVVGLAAPWVYRLLIYFIGKKWPDLANRLSADPYAYEEPTETGVR